VGDDSCLILWDARVGTTPVIKVRSLWLFMHVFFIFGNDPFSQFASNTLISLAKGSYSSLFIFLPEFSIWNKVGEKERMIASATHSIVQEKKTTIVSLEKHASFEPIDLTALCQFRV